MGVWLGELDAGEEVRLVVQWSGRGRDEAERGRMSVVKMEQGLETSIRGQTPPSDRVLLYGTQWDDW